METLIAALTFCLAIFLTSVTHAQSMPHKQENSIWAPEKINIDGKATEWGSKFQAYNTNVDVFYTIANDDRNLYLIIQAARPEIIQKIAKGGISLTVNSTGKNTEKSGIVVTYPV